MLTAHEIARILLAGPDLPVAVDDPEWMGPVERIEVGRHRVMPDGYPVPPDERNHPDAGIGTRAFDELMNAWVRDIPVTDCILIK